MKRALAVVAGALAIEACGEAQGHDAPGARRPVAAEWTTRWTTRLPAEGAPSRSAFRLAVGNGRVYAIDPSSALLVALDAATGKVLWSTGNADTVTGLKRPRDVAVMSDGMIAVPDMDREALIVFDDKGTMRRTIPIKPVVYSTCAVDRGLLLLTWSRETPVWYVDTKTGEITRHNLPWPDLLGAMPDMTAGRFQTNDARDRCVFVRESGDGFALWTRGAFGPVRAFVDSTAAARTGSRRPPVSGSIVDSDVYVTFGSSKDDRDQSVDVYDAESGKYKASYRTPRRMLWLTHRAGVFYGISSVDGGREIVALTLKKP